MTVENVTANDIIRRAMRLCGAIDPTESPSADEARDGLMALNGFVGQLATQRLTIYVTERALFDLVSGQADYTIGDGGDFDRQRPNFLPWISVIQDTSSDYPLELPLKILSTQQWQQQVPQKATTSALPTQVYYNFAFAAGLGQISYFPVPNVGGLQTAIYCPTALSEFVNYATEYRMPPGYFDMLCYGLAVRIAPEYHRKVPQVVAALAMETLANIKRANIRIEEMRVDPALTPKSGGYWNWISGQFVGSGN